MRGLTTRQRAVLAELYQRTQCAATELADAAGLTLRATHQHLDALETKGMLTSRVVSPLRHPLRVVRITPAGIVALAVQP